MEPSGTPALLSCTMTPRPASIRIFSSPSLISVVVAMRRGSGRGPPVPSSMTSMAPAPDADLSDRTVDLKLLAGQAAVRPPRRGTLSARIRHNCRLYLHGAAHSARDENC